MPTTSLLEHKQRELEKTALPGKVRGLPGITDVTVEIVWEPPWDPSRMSEAARLQLGM